MISVKDRVKHPKNGWGAVIKINLHSRGKTGRATALVDWETHQVKRDNKHGPKRTWVSLSNLSSEAFPSVEHEKPRFPAAYDFMLPEEVLEADVIEGAIRSVTVNAYERDPNARAQCIAVHGINCHVCGLNFETIYGDVGKSYIHIHHLRPLSEVKEAHTVNPVEDLRPVCPNCHAMLHRRCPVFSIEELKAIISKRTVRRRAT